MPFAITDGRLAAIGQDIMPGSVPRRRTLRLGAGRVQSYAQIYRTQPAVRTVIDFLARGVASMACQSFERLSDTDRKRIDPFTADMAFMLEYEANPTTTGYRLHHGLISDRALYDAAYLLKVRGSGTSPVYLRRVPPNRISPVGGDWYEVDSWRISGEKGYIDVPAADVVVFSGYNPEDTRIGTSPIETLRAILSEEYSAMQARALLWERGNLAAGTLTRPADAPEWTSVERERFEADWSAYLIDGPKAGSTPVLEDGMSWVPAGFSPKDAQFVESRKLTREEVASAYHIAPPLVGILDHATFSNIEEQHIGLYVDTLGAWTSSTEAEWNMQLVPDFYDRRKVYVEYNIGAKLKGDFEQQASMLQVAIGAPYMTPNEGRGRINLPALPGGDELVRPLNVTSGEQANPQDSAPEPGDVNPLDSNQPAKRRRLVRKAAPETEVAAHVAMLAKFFERQRRSVLGKYQGLKTVVEVHDIFDLARWNVELSADLLKLALPLSLIVGGGVANSLDGQFDPGQTVNYLTAQTAGAAASINLGTRNDIGAALTARDVEAALAATFALAVASRALASGRTQATNVAGWSSVEAGRQTVGAAHARKRWVTGAHARESHAIMGGQTVALDEKFSNGARWPADVINLAPDEFMGCNCDLEILPEGVAE